MSAPFDVLACPLEGTNLVEASAGTGKTWNICGLYLRLLLERELPVERILVVTFTNAATAELRERVRARIVEMLAHVSGRPAVGADPFVPMLTRSLESRGLSRATLRERLDLALQSFDQAAILTIHGWSQRALSETPFTRGRPFALELQPDDSELRLSVVHDFWRRHVAGDGCPAALAAWLDGRKVTPESLAALLARHLSKPLAHERWPDDIDVPLRLDADALDAAFAAARTLWARSRADIVDVLESGRAALHATTYKADAVEQAFADWDEWLAHDALMPIKWKQRKLERLTTTCLAKAAKRGQPVPQHAFFDVADVLVEQRKAAEAQLERARLRLVRRLFDEGGAALRERKEEARLASYDDLLRNLHEALQGTHGPEQARVLRERFPVALIDEFQDTDPVQFAIFQAIYGAGDAPLFLVGDPKQAIYAFRHADLHTYLRAARDVRSTWTLTHNQRSSPGLVRAVNALFDGNPRAFMLDGLAYRDVEVGAKPRKVLEDRTGAGAELRVWTLPRWRDGAPMERRDALEAAAAATAAEIARLLRAAQAGDITLDGRALAPHDIAVLVRTHRQGDAIKQSLAALGIGSVELSQVTVFKSVDAEDVERLLAAILAPSDDGLLRAALATEIIGLDAAAIAALEQDTPRLIDYVQRFAAYRQTWQDGGVAVMFRAMLAQERVAARMLARPDGERRLTNLLHLGELLHAAGETHRAPDALVRWLATQRRDDARDEAAQLRLESDRNLVQIVTIHKVKGLEYPIVFCPFLFDALRANGVAPEGCEYHDDAGRAVVDFRGDDELGDEAKAIKARIRLEKSAEDLRLVYVALTRASHRCYLVAGCYARLYFGKRSAKESSSGLLNWLVAGGGSEPGQWLESGCPPEAIEDAWARLGRALAPHAACMALPTTPGEPVVPTRPAPEALAAGKVPERIAEPWRISSFSGLHDGAINERAANDHDAPGSDSEGAVAIAARASPPAELAADDILRFPRGIGAGDCLHAALENIDFAEEATWDAGIARALREHPVSLANLPLHAQQPVLHRMIFRMIADLVRTGLPDGIRLDAVTPGKRLTELEFNLPAHDVAAPALNAALKSLGYAVDRLTFARLHGYLRGFIDLVFEHRGRYYFIDWKSNHLGYTPAEYAPAALEGAMAQHGYHLQSLIYAVALSRYLAHRVPGYRHETHFGGTLYVFLRGVRPGWISPHGGAAGVHFHRPSAATVAHLDRLLQPGARVPA